MNYLKSSKDFKNKVASLVSERESLEEELENFTNRMQYNIEKINDQIRDKHLELDVLHDLHLRDIYTSLLKQHNESGEFVLEVFGEKGCGIVCDDDFWWTVSNDLINSTIIFDTWNAAAAAIPDYSRCNKTGRVYSARIRKVVTKETVTTTRDIE